MKQPLRDGGLPGHLAGQGKTFVQRGFGEVELSRSKMHKRQDDQAGTDALRIAHPTQHRQAGLSEIASPREVAALASAANQDLHGFGGSVLRPGGLVQLQALVPMGTGGIVLTSAELDARQRAECAGDGVRVAFRAADRKAGVDQRLRLGQATLLVSDLGDVAQDGGFAVLVALGAHHGEALSEALARRGIVAHRAQQRTEIVQQLAYVRLPVVGPCQHQPFFPGRAGRRIVSW